MKNDHSNYHHLLSIRNKAIKEWIKKRENKRHEKFNVIRHIMCMSMFTTTLGTIFILVSFICFLLLHPFLYCIIPNNWYQNSTFSFLANVGLRLTWIPNNPPFKVKSLQPHWYTRSPAEAFSTTSNPFRPSLYHHSFLMRHAYLEPLLGRLSIQGPYYTLLSRF